MKPTLGVAFIVSRESQPNHVITRIKPGQYDVFTQDSGSNQIKAANKAKGASRHQIEGQGESALASTCKERESMTRSGRVRTLMTRFSPNGEARCIPVSEYLEARSSGNLDLQSAFCNTLVLRNGVSKMTATHRMDDLFPVILRHAVSIRSDPFKVLDVGCSAGVSTSELHAALGAAGFAVQTFGTDLMLYASYVVGPNGISVLFDDDKLLLQIDIGSWGSSWRWRRRDLVFRPCRSLRARRVASRGLDKFRSALDVPRTGYRVARIPLLAPNLDEVANLHFAEEDILRPVIPGPFAIIRVANVLNRVYFAEQTIKQMARALFSRIKDGGLLLVVRTGLGSNVNRGTLFRRTGDRLAVVESVNGGSEVADIVEAGARFHHESQ